MESDQEHWLAFHCGQSLAVWWLDDVRYYRGGPDDEVIVIDEPGRSVDPAGKTVIAWGGIKKDHR